MDEKAKKSAPGGGVTPSSGDTDIDQLLRARAEIDAALHRHKAQFTVLFTDIVGSTAFFERYGDTAGLMMLQRHHELVLPPIEETGGTVVKTIGDAVLAVFNAAVPAVRAAIKIQQNLDAYNQERPAAERIYTRVGLNFGSGFVKEKDVFGDVVNVAARFVKACLPAQILVSRTVAEAVENEKGVVCRRLGSAEFHGKSAPEDIFEVVWTTEERYQRLRAQLDAAEAQKTTRSVLGRYEIMDELGRGAMGIVYKAYDPVVGRIVALKTVRLDATGKEREELVARLRQEAQAAGRLDHPNIVTLYDAGEAEGLFYLTMHYVKGKPLSELMGEGRQLPVKQILLLMDQVCDGLHYAHERGIVHRDLKPSNIIVAAEGMAKILDFGVAKVAETGTTRAGTVLGTPSYMSPEQAQGARVDRRSDIFSLGAIFYELLTGEKAFPGNTPTAIIHKIVHEEPIPPRVLEPGIDPALEDIIRRALAKDPLQRYQTCKELLQDLKVIGKPAPRPAPAPSERAARAAPRREPARPGAARQAVTSVLAAALLAAGGYLAWQGGLLATLGLGPSPARQSAPRQPAAAGQPVAAPPAMQPIQTPTTGTQPPAQPPARAQPSAAKPPAAEPKAEKPTKRERARRKEETARQQEASAEPAAAEKPAAAEEKPAQPAARAEEKPAKPGPATPPASARPPEQQQQVNRWFLQAEDYIRKGRYKEASFALEQILKIDPKNERAKAELERLRKMQELRRTP